MFEQHTQKPKILYENSFRDHVVFQISLIIVLGSLNIFDCNFFFYNRQKTIFIVKKKLFHRFTVNWALFNRNRLSYRCLSQRETKNEKITQKTHNTASGNTTTHLHFETN